MEVCWLTGFVWACIVFVFSSANNEALRAHIYTHMYVYIHMYIYTYPNTHFISYIIETCWLTSDIHACIHAYIHTYMLAYGFCMGMKFFFQRIMKPPALTYSPLSGVLDTWSGYTHLYVFMHVCMYGCVCVCTVDKNMYVCMHTTHITHENM
jgi:hypothetical protein